MTTQRFTDTYPRLRVSPTDTVRVGPFSITEHAFTDAPADIQDRLLVGALEQEVVIAGVLAAGLEELFGRCPILAPEDDA